MSRPASRASVTIDGRPLEVAAGSTILQAARWNGIYIPTLCFHEALSPFGGCRLCIVEVEGMGRFPTACTTPVEDGMVVRTTTAQVQAVRAEVLQLILSEHPASCLVCDEKDACTSFSGTIRKAGVTTGCRYCSADGRCELQELARRLGVDEIRYPVSYRNQRVEREDPFYDRDYNLCILCGRCVRMCQEVRAAGTLAFTQRGNRTVIGPAFGRTHLAAGCEFCGACVSVCPTGALAEKARKWDGLPEREQVTTCGFCGVGCQLRLQVKGARVIGAVPAEGVAPNDGQLCVKGRFCVPEIVNHPKRLLRPLKLESGTAVDVGWDEAIALAAERLAACPPAQFRLLASPSCSNEDLYVAQKFARVAIGSGRIDTSASSFYGDGFDAYLRLLERGVALADVRAADVVVCIGLDVRYGRSVVGVALRRAVDRGARVVTIHPRDHGLAVLAEQWLRPEPGREAELLESLAAACARPAPPARLQAPEGPPGISSGEIAAVAAALATAKAPIVLVGSELLHAADASRTLAAVARLADAAGAGLVPLPVHNNLVGSLLMGAYQDLLPGGHAIGDAARRAALEQRWGAPLPLPGEEPAAPTAVLYLVGELPPPAAAAPPFVIAHALYAPAPAGSVDLALPAAAFSEVDGTTVNGERRVLRLHRAVPPPGGALPDWEILCRIARALGRSGFEFTRPEEIHEEVASLVDGFGSFADPSAEPLALRIAGVAARPAAEPAPEPDGGEALPYTLVLTPPEHGYRGNPLAARVAGAAVLFPDQLVEVNPRDALAVGIGEADSVRLTAPGFERTLRARLVVAQPPGTLRAGVPWNGPIGAGSLRVRLEKAHG